MTPETAGAARHWRDLDWHAHTHLAVLADGSRVSYVDVGTGAGPPLLFVHGLGESWQVWLENLAVLAGDRRVIAVDLPGFGASPHIGGGSHSYYGYAVTVDRFCAELGLPPAVVVGHSLGGWISAELASSFPERVAGLVLVDAAGIYPTAAERRRVVSALRLAGRAGPVMSRHRERLVGHPVARKLALGVLVSRPDALAADLALQLLPAEASPCFRPTLEENIRCWSPAWCERIAGMRVPALVVWGEQDRQFPLRHAREWVRLLPDSRLVVAPGCSHLPMVENPGLVNAEIGRLHTEVTGRAEVGQRR